ARGAKPLHQVLQGRRGRRALAAQRETGIEIGVEHHALMAIAHQAPGDVCAHAAETDDSDLHPAIPLRRHPGAADRPSPGSITTNREILLVRWLWIPGSPP